VGIGGGGWGATSILKILRIFFVIIITAVLHLQCQEESMIVCVFECLRDYSL
jgi:hypothetical protein